LNLSGVTSLTLTNSTINGIGGAQAFGQISFVGGIPSASAIDGATGVTVQSNGITLAERAANPLSSPLASPNPGASLGVGAGVLPAAGCEQGQDSDACSKASATASANQPLPAIDYGNRFLEGTSGTP
jgi:hypothetical protein